MIASLLSGVGAASNAGLNSTLALIILALADRLTTRIDLASPYSWISSTAGIVVILLLMPIELIADKLPGIDALSDRVHTVIRPLVGGFIAMAIASQPGGINVWVAGVLGLAVAAGVHWYKMKSRPVVTAASNGVANPFLSIAEDLAVIAGTVVSIFVPWGAIPVMAILLWLVYRFTERMKRGGFRIEALLGVKPKV
ncbi:MAG TPA: DUF4126 domain-containing protein [Thermomicrobiales bacterium]|nr:DUF4126 domain-containing protein [Thermomicrobiales bacterium]